MRHLLFTRQLMIVSPTINVFAEWNNRRNWRAREVEPRLVVTYPRFGYARQRRCTESDRFVLKLVKIARECSLSLIHGKRSDMFNCGINVARADTE